MLRLTTFDSTTLLRIRVIQAPDGVVIQGVDSSGNKHDLLCLVDRGEIGRFRNVSPKLGFQLEADGSIKIG